ncbi:transcriptional repressor LexA [Corynebacterium choanae]|uniref:LexA repressor n=1 Tax=Corynebacterium choanae TaxID=1862358 RepID=A0A3G6J7G3_9CORY|nr:transcriptional repressor LexA [Corynebacterium choanae]AZA13762.1 LexA repressor [Corynebacterium choanae]
MPRAKFEHQLTGRQRRILDVIQDATVLRGYPPSIREIGEAVGLTSTSSVSYQLKELERKGYLRRDPFKPRAVDVRTAPRKIEPTPRASHLETETDAPPNHEGVAFVPMVGSIAAGNPTLAVEETEAYYPIPEELVSPGELMMLKVVGESMRDAGILSGDWVVIRRQPDCEHGDFVAALIDGEATVKEFRRTTLGPILHPHNLAFDDIRARDAVILGVVVTVLRKL